VQVVVAVQFRVIPEKAASAFYKLTDHKGQIKSYVFDVIRSQVPRMELDETFVSKSNIADAVRDQLATLMIEYGYEILVALITDISPEPKVKNAMNEINAAARLREAASHKADAEKILEVKGAEADAESKYLSGLGIARQRRAIVDGLRETVSNFSESIPGTTPQDVMDLLLLIQYFDVMKDITGPAKQSSLFLPHGPGSVLRLRESLHSHVVPEARKLQLP
jgi:regulator of protease activity HflC (stomatin/prohibitin superfamily)